KVPEELLLGDGFSSCANVAGEALEAMGHFKLAAPIYEQGATNLSGTEHDRACMYQNSGIAYKRVENYPKAEEMWLGSFRVRLSLQAAGEKEPGEMSVKELKTAARALGGKSLKGLTEKSEYVAGVKAGRVARLLRMQDEISSFVTMVNAWVGEATDLRTIAEQCLFGGVLFFCRYDMPDRLNTTLFGSVSGWAPLVVKAGMTEVEAKATLYDAFSTSTAEEFHQVLKRVKGEKEMGGPGMQITKVISGRGSGAKEAYRKSQMQNARDQTRNFTAPKSKKGQLVQCGNGACPTAGEAKDRSAMKMCPCRIAFYCCPACQKAHWKEHKAAHKKAATEEAAKAKGGAAAPGLRQVQLPDGMKASDGYLCTADELPPGCKIIEM
ncbi:hypothetical protein TeGR_g9705, partial [Tetraparma gracilis]